MKYKRSLSILLAVVLLVSTAMLFVHAVSLTDEPVRNAREVISEELLELLEQRARQRFRVATNAQTVELPMEDQLPVSVWLTGIDADAVEAAALEETGWNRDLIRERSAAGEDIPSDDVDAYIEAERRIYAQRQRAANEAFLASCPATLSDSETSTQFVSAYAPMVLADASDAAIWTLASCAEVESISYMPEMEVEQETTGTGQATTRSDYSRDTLGYTGKGVKIGMVERAMPSTIFLTNSRVIMNSANALTDEAAVKHATRVAEIMVSAGNPTTGSQTKGIAPDAMLYCAASTNNLNYFTAFEWLLEQGVHVINVSTCFNAWMGTYSEIDKWVDHIAIEHDVHVVVAAGNTGNQSAKVVNPGLAYNAITAGNLDDKGTVDLSDDVLRYTSSYKQGEECANKPDLVAPGTAIMTSSYFEGDSGTSYSAPHVAGIIAQLLEQNAGLKTQQNTVKAILTAAINHNDIRYTTADTVNFEQYGAGCVDARGAGYAARQNQYRGSNFAANTSAGSTKEYSFTIKSSDDLKRISLTWLKRVSIIGSHTDSNPTFNEGTFPRLKLEILNASGTVIQTAYHSTGNLEIVQLDNPAAGTYKIRVTLMTSSNQQVNFAVAWW